MHQKSDVFRFYSLPSRRRLRWFRIRPPPGFYVMHQPVDGCRRHHGIVEDLLVWRRRPSCWLSGRCPFVTPANKVNATSNIVPALLQVT